MAFQKSVTWRGASANYFRISDFRWSRAAREASATFALYVSSTVAESSDPALVPEVALLRLYADKFDEYLSPAALAAAEGDVVAQLYLAARHTAEAAHTSQVTDHKAHIISDLGRDAFWDAVDV